MAEVGNKARLASKPRKTLPQTHKPSHRKLRSNPRLPEAHEKLREEQRELVVLVEDRGEARSGGEGGGLSQHCG